MTRTAYVHKDPSNCLGARIATLFDASTHNRGITDRTFTANTDTITTTYPCRGAQYAQLTLERGVANTFRISWSSQGVQKIYDVSLDRYGKGTVTDCTLKLEDGTVLSRELNGAVALEVLQLLGEFPVQLPQFAAQSYELPRRLIKGAVLTFPLGGEQASGKSGLDTEGLKANVPYLVISRAYSVPHGDFEVSLRQATFNPELQCWQGDLSASPISIYRTILPDYVVTSMPGEKCNASVTMPVLRDSELPKFR